MGVVNLDKASWVSGEGEGVHEVPRLLELMSRGPACFLLIVFPGQQHSSGQFASKCNVIKQHTISIAIGLLV